MLQSSSIQAEQCAGEPGVPHMKPWRLDKPRELVSVPGRQALEQEDSFKEGHVLVNRLSSEAEGAREVGDVEQSPGIA